MVKIVTGLGKTNLWQFSTTLVFYSFAIIHSLVFCFCQWLLFNLNCVAFGPLFQARA